MTRALVTGSLGYLGSVLTPYLSARGVSCIGYDIGLFADCLLYTPDDGVTRAIDARDVSEGDIRSVDVVVHLAGISNDPVGALDAAATYDPTRAYAIRLASLCRETGRRFIFASSCSVYGVGEGGLMTEESEARPQTPYSLNKLQIEEDLRRLGRPGFSPMALRFATAFGLSPRIRFDVVVNMLTGMAATTGRIVLNSDGRSWRPHVHVLDICEAVYRAVQSNYDAGELLVVNVGTEANNLQVIDVARLVQAAVPGAEIRFLAGRPDLDPSGLVADRKVGAGVDTRTYQVSFARAREVFPGFACEWSVARGIRQLLDGFATAGLSAEGFRRRGFYRLQHLEDLFNADRIDHNFRWRPRQA